MLRIGHKGADLIAPGNTPESFAAAVEAGVEMIELDVLRPRSDFASSEGWKNAPAGPATKPGGGPCDPLLVAHDWGDAARREPLTLSEVLEVFRRPPLDRVEIDLDLKVAGREDEVLAALRSQGLLGRACVSTMEVQSLVWLGREEPDLRRGWTLPKVYRDWNRARLLRPVILGGSALLRARLPARVRSRARALGAWAVWVYHPMITARLLAAARAAEVAVIAWTVDEPERMRSLAELGVDGICTNDPRLFARLGASAA